MAVLMDNEKVEAGKYLEHFVAADYNIPSGVYYYTLQVGEVVEKQKMILVD